MAQLIAKDVILILIDISGYTRFMTQNKQTIDNQQIISKILRDIIDSVKLPLHIAKIEGDAIFIYAVRRHEHLWPREKMLIGSRLEDFFCIFADVLVRLSGSKLCRYNRCKNIDKLKL